MPGDGVVDTAVAETTETQLTEVTTVNGVVPVAVNVATEVFEDVVPPMFPLDDIETMEGSAGP